MRELSISISVILFLVLAFSCANQTSPTGGPKDSIPPILIKVTPQNKTTNFSSSTVELEFNEHVQVNNAREQLLISPSLEKDIELTARKKIVTLKLNSKLKDSTTYTFNFRESIQDITEKNPAQNLQLVYSTGTFIDSMFIQGYVYDMLTSSPTEDATIAVYHNADTFNIFDHQPEYITKTNKNGSFKLENLKVDDYYIYAFKDANKNLKVDSKSEEYGFIKTVQHLTSVDSNTSISIGLLKIDSRPLKLISARPYNTYFNIKTAKNLKDFTITAVDSTQQIPLHYQFGEEKSNVKLYATLMQNDSMAIQFHAIDSMDFTLDTLLYAKLIEQEVTPERFTLKIENPKIILNKEILHAQISYTKPIASFNEDSAYYQVDSLTSIPITLKYFTWDNKKGKGELHIPVKKEYFTSTEEPGNSISGTNINSSLLNKLVFGKGAFISIENDSSAASEQTPKILQPEDAGIILVKVETEQLHFITQIVNADLSVEQSTIDQKESTFTNLPPASYQIRLVIDTNGNGKWDPGNFYKKEEPEPIVSYRSEKGETKVTIKANWELGPLLITYPQRVDNLNSFPKEKKPQGRKPK